MSLPALCIALDEQLRLGEAGQLDAPALFVDLDEPVPDAVVERAGAAARSTTRVVVGVSRHPLHAAGARLAQTLTCSLTSYPVVDRWLVHVSDVARSAARIGHAVVAKPRAAATLAGLLRVASVSDVRAGLVAESLAYSMLMAAPEFQCWLAGRSRRSTPEPAAEPVLLRRGGDDLQIVLNRPDRHNAFDRGIRDGLVSAFELLATDRTIARAVLSGTGPSFCSGGDLDEFGSSNDVSIAHLIRLDRSVAARLHDVRNRVTVVLHGHSWGAGVEIPTFAGHVLARPGTDIRLPELEMGLIPGAGGTVGITRRVGRWRAAYLILSGESVDLATAIDWGLVDGIA